MGYVYIKKEEEKKDGKTINVVEYVNRMFNQQANQQKEADQPRTESPK